MFIQIRVFLLFAEPRELHTQLQTCERMVLKLHVLSASSSQSTLVLSPNRSCTGSALALLTGQPFSVQNVYKNSKTCLESKLTPIRYEKQS